MKKIVFLCLLVLSVNAVLIHTIAAENELLKNGLRVAILAISVLLLIIKQRPLLVGLLLLFNVSVINLAIGHNTDQLSYIFIFIFIQALFVLNARQTEKYLMLSSVISLLLVFAFLMLGITENTVTEYRNRMMFGTNGVPFFFNLVYGAFTMFLIYVLKYFKRFKFLLMLVSIGITTYLFTLTDARGGYISFVAFIILLGIIPIISKVGIFRRIVALIPVIAIGGSYYIAGLSDSLSANMLLSNRPLLLNAFFKDISFADLLISTSVKAYDADSIVDNSYVHLLAGGGLIITLAICYLFFKAILQLFKHKKHIEIAFIVATCLYFNTESIMVRVENLFVIYFWYLIIKYSLTKIEPETEEVKETRPKRRLLKGYKIVW
jgi:hypothetical protein